MYYLSETDIKLPVIFCQVVPLSGVNHTAEMVFLDVFLLDNMHTISKQFIYNILNQMDNILTC
jgi:hypothetical protein